MFLKSLGFAGWSQAAPPPEESGFSLANSDSYRKGEMSQHLPWDKPGEIFGLISLWQKQQTGILCYYLSPLPLGSEYVQKPEWDSGYCVSCAVHSSMGAAHLLPPLCSLL